MKIPKLYSEFYYKNRIVNFTETTRLVDNNRQSAIAAVMQYTWIEKVIYGMIEENYWNS